MNLESYFPVLLFILVGIGVGGGAMLVGRVLAPHRPDGQKLSPYECGFEAFEDARMQFFEIFKADKVEVISDMDTLMVHLAALAEVNGRLRQRPHHRTDLKQTLSTLLSMTDEYREAVSKQG